MESSFDRNTQFYYGSSPLGFGAIEFWEWFASYNLDGSIRGGLAEFLVMKALEIEQDRNIWEPYDLSFLGFRIEIKSASIYTKKHRGGFHYEYLENKRISYIIEIKHQHIIGREWTSKSRHSDFYIFTLLTGTDSSHLENWEFYVVPTSFLNRKFPEQKTLSLSAIKNLGFPKCEYRTLKSALENLINGGNEMSYDQRTENSNCRENEGLKLELERLIACYQLASRDDKNVVWAALNKYASQIDKI